MIQKMKSRTLIMAVSMVLAWPLNAVSQASDSTANHKSARFHHIGDTLKAYFKTPVTPKPMGWKAFVVPAALVSYGTLSVTTDVFDDINLFGKRWATDNEDPDRKT